ncbi:Pre-mRNA-splicing factor cwf16 [Lecanora helva]
MSERKVLTKYYPPDFDPSKITRTRGPRTVGPKTQTVRLMAPFSMKCTTCGEYIYKGRKFNARKETTDEKYLNIAIYRFYIRCTRCSAEITFKTDPRAMDYECERGARRNFEIWRSNSPDSANKLETDEERLDRLEAERAEAGGVMEELEMKVHDAKTEMEIADALDEIRTRNARIGRAEGKGDEGDGEERVRREREEERRRLEEEDAETAKRAFARALGEDIEIEEKGLNGMLNGEQVAAPAVDGSTPEEERPKVGDMAPPPPKQNANTQSQTQTQTSAPPDFKRVVKKKKDFSAALGIKKRPSLL